MCESVRTTEKEFVETDKRIGEAQRKQADETARAYTTAVGKLALVVTAAIEAGRAIGNAIGSTVSGFDRLHFVSGRTGASVANLKALSFAFEQVGGSSQQALAAVESFSQKMRTNVGLRSYVRNLGVDQTKDTIDQIIDTVAALQKKGGYEVGHMQAGMLGIDEASYNLFVRRGAELKRYNEEYKGTLKDLGLAADKAGKSSAQLMQAFGLLSAKLQAVFDKILTDILLTATSALPTLGEWFTQNAPMIDSVIRAVEANLKDFLKWIGKIFLELKAGPEDGLIKEGLKNFAKTMELYSVSLGKSIGYLQSVQDVSKSGLLGGDNNVKPAPDGVLGLGAIGGSGALVGGGETAEPAAVAAFGIARRGGSVASSGAAGVRSLRRRRYE